MTEKRFKHHMGFICEKRDGEYYSFTVKEVTDLLNALNDENEQLKKQSTHFECEMYAYKGSEEYYKQLFEEKCNEYEQLKHELLCRQLDKAPTEPVNCRCSTR